MKENYPAELQAFYDSWARRVAKDEISMFGIPSIMDFVIDYLDLTNPDFRRAEMVGRNQLISDALSQLLARGKEITASQQVVGQLSKTAEATN